MSNIQLTQASGYKTTNMKFSEPVEGSVPESNPKIEFKRINITTKYEDGTSGPLILPTGRLFSFGLQENLNAETKKVNGYVVPLCLYNRDGASKAEKDWVDTFNNIIEACKDHLVDVRNQIGEHELEKSDLKKFNPLYYKRDKEKGSKTFGKIVDGSGPTLYTKVLESKKNNTIITMFYDQDDEPINALDLLGKFMHTEAAVKIESIFIGSKITMQIKLYEASACELSQNSMTRLMQRPKANGIVRASKLVNPLKEEAKEDAEEEEGEEQEDGDEDTIEVEEDDEPVPEPVVKKKVVKRVVKKVVRKA